jgi:ADP-heptose:LPS heptosyltransferase
LKVLIIRFSSIGDIVLTTPIIRCLKKQLPADSEVHYLTKPSYASLLIQNPYIDKLLLLDEDLAVTIKEIKDETYDAIIDLHNNLRTLTIKIACDSPNYTFNKLNLRKFFLTSFKINFLPKIHIVDRYFKAVAKLNITNDGEGLDYFMPTASKDLRHDFKAIPTNDFVSVAIGGQHATKRMPLEKLKEIVESSTIFLVIIGGKEDQEVAQDLEKQYPDKLLNLVGKLNLHQSAGIIEMSKKLLTHDTGMMHIAAALKKPVIAIWGNTVPEFGMYPYYGKHQIDFQNFEVKGLRCRPCSKLGYAKCPKGHFNCMNLQDTSAIAQALS